MGDASAHGYLSKPISRQYMSKIHYQDGMPTSMQWDPDASELGGACGADGEYEESTAEWDAWFEAAGVEVPVLLPGHEFEYNGHMKIDHGGQAWLQIACADAPALDLDWVLLERAPGDRNHHILPSSKSMYAWPFMSSAEQTPRYVVPHDFHCPSGRGVGRWLWKTGNSCIDANNIGNHKTEAFSFDEWCALVGHCVLDVCTDRSYPAPGGGGRIETFLSCFDFKTAAGPAPAPTPTPPTPAPVPAAPQCCYVAWGDETSCGNYPGPAGQGLCNNDFSRHCTLASDCESGVVTFTV